MQIALDHQIENCPHFKWSEALFLARWDIHCWPADEDIYKNIVRVAQKMELVRACLGKPLKVTSWYRPPHYNITIGGAKSSAHKDGLACDFVPIGMDVNYAKKLLVPHLDKLGIRMENNGKGLWIHIDLKPPGYSGRFFNP